MMMLSFDWLWLVRVAPQTFLKNAAMEQRMRDPLEYLKGTPDKPKDTPTASYVPCCAV